MVIPCAGSRDIDPFQFPLVFPALERLGIPVQYRRRLSSAHDVAGERFAQCFVLQPNQVQLVIQWPRPRRGTGRNRWGGMIDEGLHLLCCGRCVEQVREFARRLRRLGRSVARVGEKPVAQEAVAPGVEADSPDLERQPLVLEQRTGSACDFDDEYERA